MSENIGYIGLGIMGRPAAINLIKAGHRVHIWARRQESIDPVAREGGVACPSPRAVAQEADYVFVNVSDTADVEEVVLGEQGVIDGIRPGSVVVDMSTISPSATRSIAARLRERGAEMLDAPVSGGEKGAVSGTLSFMVGGAPGTFERARPLLEVMGGNIVHVGDNGAGQVAKACNQVVIAQTIAAVGEAFVLARASGVDPAKVRQALLGGFAGSRVLEGHGQRMLDHDFAPGFKARLHRKDMRITLEAASELGIALPGAALATQYINALVGTGGGELDSSAIYRLQEAMCGLRGPDGEV
jgi:2-hydroxy-3-oxopropionate reductase